MSVPKIMSQAAVLNILAAIDKHEVMVEKTWPWTERNGRRDELPYKTIPRRFMRYLIGAGLVQPHGLRWDGGEWVYRLTELGSRLLPPSAVRPAGD